LGYKKWFVSRALLQITGGGASFPKITGEGGKLFVYFSISYGVLTHFNAIIVEPEEQ
jgi:hypothetical protein